MSKLEDELSKIVPQEQLGTGLIILSQYKPGKNNSPIKVDHLPAKIRDKISNLANKMVDIAFSDELTKQIEQLSSEKKELLEKYIDEKVAKAKGVFLGSYKSIYDTIRAAVRIEYNNCLKSIIEFFEKLNKCKSNREFSTLLKEANSNRYKDKTILRRCREKVNKVYNDCIELFNKDRENKIENKLNEMADMCKKIVNANILKTSGKGSGARAAKVAQAFRNVKLACEYKNKELHDEDIKILDDIFKKNSRQWKEFTNESDYKNAIIPVGGKTNWAIINLISSFIQVQDGFNFDKSIEDYVAAEK